MATQTQTLGMVDVSDFLTRKQAVARIKRDIEAMYGPHHEAYKVMHAQLDWLEGMLLMAETTVATKPKTTKLERKLLRELNGDEKALLSELAGDTKGV